MQEICLFIKEIGFPIFVAVYLLVRLEPQLARLTEAITALTLVVQNCNGPQMDVPARRRVIIPQLKLVRRLKGDTTI